MNKALLTGVLFYLTAKDNYLSFLKSYMLRPLFISFFALLIFTSCNQGNDQPDFSEPLQTGRDFINATLKGNNDFARKYILKDSINVMYFDRFTEFYNKKPETEKQGYKDANIIINSTDNVSDSVTIINYSNTFKKEPAKIKLVKINNEWRVDFKYTFSGNM